MREEEWDGDWWSMWKAGEGGGKGGTEQSRINFKVQGESEWREGGVGGGTL